MMNLSLKDIVQTKDPIPPVYFTLSYTILFLFNHTLLPLVQYTKLARMYYSKQQSP